MILTGNQIRKEVEKGTIIIEPFTDKHLGPNSYDVTLNSKLIVYDLKNETHLDLKKENKTREIVIPEEGFLMEPNTLYLGCTNETATSMNYVPFFEGRSSMGRLGISTHITAGFGDLGWGFHENSQGEMVCQYPTWTLEITVVHPVKIFPDIRLGQIYFIRPEGEISFYKGKYSSQKNPQASKSFKDFSPN